MNLQTCKPKKRGRPPNPPKMIPKFFVSDCPDRNLLSQDIAKELGILPNTITDQLADAAGSYSAMSKLQQEAKMKRKGGGNRPKSHISILFRDCALTYERETGEDGETGEIAIGELRKIGGWEEEGNAPPSQVLKYVKAIMAALGIKHAQSLRHQARMAIKFF